MKKINYILFFLLFFVAKMTFQRNFLYKTHLKPLILLQQNTKEEKNKDKEKVIIILILYNCDFFKERRNYMELLILLWKKQNSHKG